MNDDQVLTAVRDSFADVRLDVPLERTVGRGRALRAGRRTRQLAGVAGAAALAGVTAVAVTGLGRADAPATATHQGTARLDAWTVTKAPNGIVNVTIRQLSDEAGLQQALRADGVPVWVTFTSGIVSDSPPLPKGCRTVAMSDTANANLQAKILGLPTDPKTGMMSGPRFAPGIALSIHTRQIPDGVGINLQVQPQAKRGSTVTYGWGLGLVATSPTCAG